MSAPFPALRWRSPEEKEKAFRALYAIGVKRDHGISVDVSWADLNHSPIATLISAEIGSGNRLQIYFRRESDMDVPYRTLVNSVNHLVAYAKRHVLGAQP